jgi:hypothetical protein
VNKRPAMIVSAVLIVALIAGAYLLGIGLIHTKKPASATTNPRKTATRTLSVQVHAPSSGGRPARSAPLGGGR